MPKDLIYSRRAAKTLQSLQEYIALHNSEDVAIHYVERIKARCEKLLLAPEQGTRQDQIRPGVRTIGFEGRVTIAFRVTQRSVRILSIAYGGRQYEPDLR